MYIYNVLPVELVIVLDHLQIVYSHFVEMAIEKQ